MDASCKIQRSIHDVRLTYKYVSRILGTYHSGVGFFFFTKNAYFFHCFVTVFDDFFTCDDSDEISLIINYRDVILIDRTIQKVFHISICVYRFISGASRDSHDGDIFHFLQVSAVDIQSSDAP